MRGSERREGAENQLVSLNELMGGNYLSDCLRPQRCLNGTVVEVAATENIPKYRFAELVRRCGLYTMYRYDLYTARSLKLNDAPSSDELTKQPDQQP